MATRIDTPLGKQIPENLFSHIDRLTKALAIAIPASWEPDDPTYREAEQASAIGDILVHAIHRQLRNRPIGYLFRADMKHRDHVTLGKASKVTGKLAHFSALEFLIEINWTAWRLLSPRQKVALIDHELCFPGETIVTGPVIDASMTRRYSGDLITVRTAAGHLLTGTPNHPILTNGGWVPLGLLKEGMHVVSCADAQRVAVAMNPHEHQVPSTIKEKASARRVRSALVPQAAEHFDACRSDCQVDVVSPDGDLMFDGPTAFAEHAREFALGGRDGVAVGLSCGGRFGHGAIAVPLASPRLVRRSEVGYSPLRREMGHSVALPVASVPNRNAASAQNAIDQINGDAKLLMQAIRRRTGEITLDQIVLISQRSFSGHVHNLQTRGAWYIANGIIAHNCHFGIEDTENGEKLVLLAHDVEEFGAIVQRWGLWKKDLASFARITQQTDLFTEAEQLADERAASEKPADKPRGKGKGATGTPLGVM